MAIAGLGTARRGISSSGGCGTVRGLACAPRLVDAVVPRFAWLARGGGAIGAVSTVTTFAFVVLGWVLFAAPSFQAAAATIRRGLMP